MTYNSEDGPPLTLLPTVVQLGGVLGEVSNSF